MSRREQSLRPLRELLGVDAGLADAAVIATAEGLRTDRILTVDERDFRATLGTTGKPFVLLPADRA